MGKQVAIIGGGASGMMAAITAAREGAAVTVYERNERPGRKILSTGNGKCNLGNEDLSPEEYHGGNRELIASCLERFGTGDTIRFFTSLGLLLKSRGGYLYPACEQAAVVLDVLRFALAEAGVEMVTLTRVTHIRRSAKGRLQVVWEGGEREFDSVVIACGGKAAPKTGSDGSGYQLAGELGLARKEVVPALTALHCREDFCKALAGVRAEAGIRILEGQRVLLEEEGELQLVDYGISGIPVFQLSGQVNYLLRQGKTLHARIDFLPQFSEEEYREFVNRRLASLKDSAGKSPEVEQFFTGILHKKLMTLLIRLAGLKTNTPAREADPARMRQVFDLCRNFSLQITGSNSFDQAQVCAGGVKLTEVTEQLEAVRVPGVYLAGEVLDVDGRCGGYNLQWAWSSGYIAGRAAAGADERKKAAAGADERKKAAAGADERKKAAAGADERKNTAADLERERKEERAAAGVAVARAGKHRGKR